MILGAEDGITFSAAGLVVIGTLLASLVGAIGVLWKQNQMAQAAQLATKDAQMTAVIASKDAQIAAQGVRIEALEKANSVLIADKDKLNGIAMQLALANRQAGKNTEVAMLMPAPERALQPPAVEDAHAS